ncbi:MAG TPA: hypothetical protein VFN09_13120 [Rhodanobacteraceae bacterium]|nr:hypothetical protein [Rhodanobacteraceae bacterium]
MRALVWCCLTLMLALPAPAQEIPSALRDWQAWVLHDAPQRDCPYLTGGDARTTVQRCIWPGQLTLAANADGGRFTLDVQVDATAWVALPGSREAWPEQVTDQGKALVVLNHAGAPAVHLARGQHRLDGVLPWSMRPAQLVVPAAIGLLSLTLDGKPVARLQRSGNTVVLGEAAASERVADALSVRVFRRLSDGLPPFLLTRIQLDVTGSAREQVLGPILPSGFVATALSSKLPARLDADGRLRVQLRSGQWQLEIAARATAPLAEVAFKLPAAPWPSRELWSYADDSAFRSSRVDGVAVDPAQAGVPPDWRALAAFVVEDGHPLAVKAGARGLQGSQGDQLSLQREMWLDFAGQGLTVDDYLRGDLQQSGRLTVAAPWQLLRAAQTGVPLPVSSDANGSGVELHATHINLDAGLRLPEYGGAIPVAGWQRHLDGIAATLHLPPGYRLLGAPGADRSPDSWVAGWSLLDLFVVALIALFAGRLLGWPMALLAAVYLALSQHEAGAPRWTLLLVMALLLLQRVLPAGALQRTSRYAATGLLALAVLWAVPFAVGQMRVALHPQLEHSALPDSAAARYSRQAPAAQEAADISARPKASPPPAPAPVVVEEQSTMAEMAPVSQPAAATQATQAMPQGPVQAGPGTPDWDVGNNYQLGWTGGVTASQTVRLVIAPAWLVRLLRVLMLGLLGVLLAKLLRTLMDAGAMRARWQWPRQATAAALALLLLPAAARAQELPTPELLQQLKARLTEAPVCAPNCAAVAAASLRLEGDRLQWSQTVHAGATVAIPLPDGGNELILSGVRVDQRPDESLLRDGGKLLLRLGPGIHQVELDYRVLADSLRLRLPLPPTRLDASVDGWTVQGVDQHRISGDGIGLQRKPPASGPAVHNEPAQTFPPYVRLIRTLEFGAEWRVHNRVQRLAPRTDGFTLRLPLLAGEHPLGDALPVKQGQVEISFKSGQYEYEWDSRLDRQDALQLVAPPLGERSEIWRLIADSAWHIDASGVPLSRSPVGALFQPLPGETLKVALNQPPRVAGDSVAFDQVRVESVAGERVIDSTLTLRARSTRGGEHAIHLPGDAELVSASRDGIAQTLSLRDGQLSLPLLPGVHDYVLQLRQPHGVASRTRSIAAALGAAAANVQVQLGLPQDRWLLWTSGPADGPAVLYWSELVVLLLLAWGLGRFAPTPLKWWHWLLLGLGFSAFDWSAFAVVALWLILLGVRQQRPPSAAMQSGYFNLIQLGLAALTVFALFALIAAVPQGLLGQPDMHVAGNGSSASQLHWFVDRVDSVVSVGSAWSLPLWTYKLAMLAWALWLANALIGWLRWAFNAWSLGGYWRRRVMPVSTEPVAETSAGASEHD